MTSQTRSRKDYLTQTDDIAVNDRHFSSMTKYNLITWLHSKIFGFSNFFHNLVVACWATL